MTTRLSWSMAFLCVCAVSLSAGPAGAEDKILFDFDNESDVKSFANIDVYALREAEAKAAIEAVAKVATNPATAPTYKPPASMPSEPAVKIEQSAAGATGKRGLKLTYAGGRMPTISAKSPLDNWRPFKSFRADVTVDRTCMVVFRAMAQTSKYGTAYNEGCSRWEFAALCKPGKNNLVARAPAAADILWKDVKAFEIYTYQPGQGQAITVENILLSTDKPEKTSPYNEVVSPTKFKVAGTDMEVADVNELADKLKDKWVKPEDKTVEQVEADIQAQYEKIKKDHPKAVLVMLRDGQKGYDAADPDKPFAGWADAGTPSHLPMSLTLASFRNAGKDADIEACFRNRPGFLKVDLSCIPKGAEILSARLVLVRNATIGTGWQTGPAMFVAEPCNRPWKEYEVNVFEYAAGEFWGDYAAQTWGDGGDCDAVFLAYGPSSGKANSWDFTRAVEYWTSGKHANNGFILHGANKYVDYFHLCTREHPDVKKRPGLAVTYEAK
jgi:hypothetical protein